MGHFANLSAETLAGIQCHEDGEPIYSLANVLRVHRPVVIVDEAHNARTDLSFDTLARFNPSCIIEFTATPDTKTSPSNVLHTISAAELHAEDMIKMPIQLETKPDWRELLADAIGHYVKVGIAHSPTFSARWQKCVRLPRLNNSWGA